MKYRYGSHTVYNIEYHFVWVTKYRYQVLVGEVGERVRAPWAYVFGCYVLEVRFPA